MVLGPSDFRDGEDVVWRLVWAAWRRIWKEDEITSVDALQASSWAKSTLGTYCTHFRKMALWVGYTPTSDLEQAACRYIFQLWGLGYSGSSLKVAVSAFRALEDMGWLPAFVSRRVWRCAKWAPTEPALRPYAGLDDLRNFALACTERPQWTVYGMAVLAFTCLLQVGEAAPLRRGGSRCRGLAFRTVKVAPRIVRRRLGKYAQAWLGWLDAKGATSAVVGAQFCPQGPAYMQSVMAAALGGSDNPHARWHAWRRGGSAALRWIGLPIKWLAWWGRWLSETVAVHYADAPDDFVVTSEAVLPWPSDDPTGEFVWRAVSLRDVFPRELLELCAPDADEPPKWGDDGDGSAGGRGGSCLGESAGSATAGAARGEDRAGAQDPGAPPALTAIEGSSGRGRWPRGDGGGGVIDVDADPPPASAAGSSIRRLRIAARRTGEGVRLGQAEGRRPGQDCGCGCPNGDFPPRRSWVSGCGSAFRPVSGTTGCVPCVLVRPARRLVCWSVASYSFLSGAVKLHGISSNRIFCESWLWLCPHLALKYGSLSCMILRRQNCLCSVSRRRFWRGAWGW